MKGKVFPLGESGPCCPSSCCPLIFLNSSNSEKPRCLRNSCSQNQVPPPPQEKTQNKEVLVYTKSEPTPNMTGRRFHRTMEMIPARPGSLKTLLLPPLLNNVQTRERKGYRRGTAPVPRSSSHIGHGSQKDILNTNTFPGGNFAPCGQTISGQLGFSDTCCRSKPPMKTTPRRSGSSAIPPYRTIGYDYTISLFVFRV